MYGSVPEEPEGIAHGTWVPLWVCLLARGHYELGTIRKEASGIMEFRWELSTWELSGDAGSGGFLNCSR